MILSIEEQETHINIDRDGNIMRIYTTDPTMMTRLDKLYRVVGTDTIGGTIVAKKYEAEKRLLTLRKDIHFKPDYQPKRRPSKENLERMVAQRRMGRQDK